MMQEIIDREIEKSGQFYSNVGLSFLSGFELSKTSDDNFDKLTDERISLLFPEHSTDFLTGEEIADIKEYRSNTESVTKFKNAKEFLDDLND